MRETTDAYCALLLQELIPATGCTEPIAYAAPSQRDTPGGLPERVEVAVSGNILKNAKSVVVPGTGGRKGIAVSAAAGIVAETRPACWRSIDNITPERLEALGDYLERTSIAVSCLEDGLTLDIRVKGRRGADSAYVRIAGAHTNITRIEKNGAVLLDRPAVDAEHENDAPRILNTADIVAFADEVDLSRVAAPLKKQLELNLASRSTGSRTAAALASAACCSAAGSDSLPTRARAWAAAGLDARMSGEEKPVVILLRLRQPGITASVPVAVWALERGYDEEKLLRALIAPTLSRCTRRRA